MHRSRGATWAVILHASADNFSTTSTLPLAASKNGDPELSVRGNDSEHAIGGRGLISIRSECAMRVLWRHPFR